jgi:anaerobic magnesium-protoporphyrin IX monomethyl ester cyclase
MKVALVGPEIEENLSLRYLMSSLARSGFDSRLVPFNSRKEARKVARTLLRLRPEIIGYSLVAQRRLADFQEVTDLLRRGGYEGHITAGGHFASLRAAEILRDESGIDSILHHEGERRIVELAHWLSASGKADDARAATRGETNGGTNDDPPDSLEGITWRGRDGALHHRPPRTLAAVDSLPFPARRRPDRTLGFARSPVVSSRGCAGDCSFCSIRAWHRQVRGSRLRFRSPESVAAEMCALHRERGVRVFIFHDDDFIHPHPGKALNRCREILERAEQRMGTSFAFVIKCRPDDVHPELFRYLKTKGLVRAYVGIETHSELGIRVLNRKVTKEVNERALAILDDLGIFSCFNLLLFHPDSTVEELQENLRFLETQVDRPFDVARTELYARSALEQRMVREGRARGDYRGFDYVIGDPEVERVFRLFSNVLWDRHFHRGSILQRVQELGYRLSLLQRFHPAMASEEFASRVRSLIREVNLDTVGYLRRLMQVPAEAARSPEALEAFQDTLRREVRTRLHEQLVRWGALSFEVECRARFGRIRVPVPARDRWPRVLWRLASSAPYAALALGTWSCGNGDVVCDPPPPPVRFRVDIEPVLDGTCAVSGCHDSGTASAGLVLESGRSYSELVGVPSSELPTMNRVEPAQPDSSYLVQKLQGTQESVGGSGERMPKGGPALPSFTDQVRKWIEDGAAED